MLNPSGRDRDLQLFYDVGTLLSLQLGFFLERFIRSTLLVDRWEAARAVQKRPTAYVNRK